MRSHGDLQKPVCDKIAYIFCYIAKELIWDWLARCGQDLAGPVTGPVTGPVDRWAGAPMDRWTGEPVGR